MKTNERNKQMNIQITRVTATKYSFKANGFEFFAETNPNSVNVAVASAQWGTRAPMAIPQGPNQRWSLEFVSDSLSCGRRFRILNVIDDFSRECLAAVVDTSLSGDRVGRELDRIAEMRGYPCMVVSDNGTEPR
ncbi:Integrase protein [Rhodobacterales bacterium HTCC2150]|nr:Integrase protein [Rhodobacterales bacterium HTCC2150] [Rhodobacteraceae bacterium HTCC2150]